MPDSWHTLSWWTFLRSNDSSLQMGKLSLRHIKYIPQIHSQWVTEPKFELQSICSKSWVFNHFSKQFLKDLDSVFKRWKRGIEPKTNK
jgi:hypothetical protein